MVLKKMKVSRFVLTIVLILSGLYIALYSAMFLLRGPVDENFSFEGGNENIKNKISVSSEDIIEWKIFGDLKNKDISAKFDKEASESQVGLKLLGVVSNEVNSKGWAILENKSGIVDIYCIGDKIGHDIIVYNVASKHVLIKNRGRIERISLFAWDKALGLVEVPTQNPNERNGDAKTEDSNLYANPRLEWLSGFGVKPVSEGVASGYRVVDSKGKLVQEYGFQEGDVVLTVNGYPIGTTNDDKMAFTSFRQSGVARIVIRRGRSNFILEYEDGGGQLRGLDSLAESR